VNSSTPYVVLCASGTISRSYTNDRFKFGRATAITGANSGMIRSIMDQTADQLTFSHPFAYTISSGDQFSIWPGCLKRTIEDCTSLYNNSKNNQAFQNIPNETDAF
jgi:hypothetical protein